MAASGTRRRTFRTCRFQVVLGATDVLINEK